MMEEQKLEVKILKDLSEEVPYDKREIPLYIRTRKIGDYVNMRSFPHWHDDIELMYIVDGQLKFNVNGRDILLHSNDCILLNIKQMHHSAAYKQQECTFTSILFHPRLFTGNQDEPAVQFPHLSVRRLLPVLRFLLRFRNCRCSSLPVRPQYHSVFPGGFW